MNHIEKADKNYQNIILIIVGAIFLSFFAFYNRFPLVYVDTAAYINRGFLNNFSMDRPMFYGWFLRFSSLEESLFLSAFLQSFILSSTIFLYFKYYLNKINTSSYFLIFIIIISFFTGASFYMSRLIPDAFTSIYALSVILLLIETKLNTKEVIYLSFFFVLSLITHNSHMMINYLIIFILLIYLFFSWIKKRSAIFPRKRVLLIIGLSIFAYLAVALSSLRFGNDFGTAQGGHAFMMNRLLKLGILQPYLDEYCEKKNYEICDYDVQKSGFLWNSKKSPLYKQGGWEKTQDEYYDIIFDLLTTPKYAAKYFARSVEATFQQFFTFKVGNRGPYGNNSLPYKEIKRFYSGQQYTFKDSLQNKDKLDPYLRYLNNAQYVTIIISFTILLLLLFNPYLKEKVPKKIRYITILIIIAVIANAIITGMFTNIRNRFQGRIIWILVLPAFMILVYHIQKIYDKLLKKR